MVTEAAVSAVRRAYAPEKIYLIARTKHLSALIIGRPKVAALNNVQENYSINDSSSDPTWNPSLHFL